ncbi:GNAT family N-acetyltransferase [Nocardia takedensis]|uniref:GNAT family N-acetyltransferase n=1 Tax=Nocardia takedensis TaxID=259390 RepID=UPI0002EBEC74|nr:GNAT family N-acetyltransferase [Nocardia takedensis]
MIEDHPTHARSATVPRRVAVRAIDSEAEIHQLTRWAAMSGIGDPDHLVEDLLEHHVDGLLGLDPAISPAVVSRTLDTHGVPAAAATRTTALVAVADGRIVGGILSGPTLWLLTRAVAAGHDHLLQALLRTTEIQVLAVDELHRRNGIGTALIRAAVAAARTMSTRVLYTRIPDTPAHTNFVRASGLTVHPPGAELDLYELAGLDLTLTPAPAERICTLRLR